MKAECQYISGCERPAAADGGVDADLCAYHRTMLKLVRASYGVFE